MKVPIPERWGRRMSIGPFERPREFLRFLVFASAGGLLALVGGLLWGLPLIAIGSILTLVHHEEEPLLSHILRRAAYYFFPRRALPPRGKHTPLGWVDSWGCHWQFYERPPLPIHGRSTEEIEEASMRLVKLLASTKEEVLLVRATEPWDMRPYLPPAGEKDSPALVAYIALLREIARDRYRARLFVGVASKEGRGKTQASLLIQEGWSPLPRWSPIPRYFLRDFLSLPNREVECEGKR